jgi:hypothetical protein
MFRNEPTSFTCPATPNSGGNVLVVVDRSTGKVREIHHYLR